MSLKDIRPLKVLNTSTQQEEIFYPATTTDAVAHPTKVKSLTTVLSEMEGGMVFDISAANASGTPPVLAKYADLSAALAAVPSTVQKGGMSIKFVQSTDNKYVQYRLMADTWSTDTNDWAIADEGVYVDNPEFIEVDVDKDNKILWGIQRDGNFYFGAGCPNQVKNYVLEHKAEILAVLAEKVDKVPGKGLSTNDFTNTDKEIVGLQKIVENLEYIDAVTDEGNKILYGVKRADGDFFFGAGVPKQIQDYVNSENMFENIEWIDNHFMYNRETLNQDAGAFDWSEDTKYSYSKPFFMKKGDMIIWNGYRQSLNRSSLNPAKACVCETTETGSANESYPILNQIYISENADYYSFIASRDMWVACNILKATKDEKHFKWYRLKAYIPIDEKGVRATPLESSEVRDLLQQCKTCEENPNQTDVFYTPQLCLLHFSDYHNDIGRLHRILQFKKKWSDYIDDVIHTGDAAGNVYSSFNIKALELDGYETMLNIIGNHDIYTDDYADSVSQKDKYDRYMKGMANAESINNNIASWGVVQPTGVGTDGYYPCYYYKDYSDMKVRLIVIDCMEYFGTGGTERNQVQLNWFISVLSNTPSEYHVIVADHYPPMNDLNDKTLLKGGFNRIGDPNYNSISMEGHYIQSYVDAIDGFIDNGGIFICWLCGHIHYDRTALIAAHPKQLFLSVPAANVHGNIQNRKRTVGEESEDLFNIVAIDTFTKVIRVARVGSKFDRDLQHQGTMCISYDTSNGNEIKVLSSY